MNTLRSLNKYQLLIHPLVFQSLHTIHFVPITLPFGDEAQRCKWLPKLTSGEYIGAWGLTEQNTGLMLRDAYYCAKEGDEWVLNGTKNFITHGRVETLPLS